MRSAQHALEGVRPLRPRRRVLPLNKFASVLFLAAFVLGVLNAAATIIHTAGVTSPDELYASGRCELAGEVRDPSGRPIPNATVLVTDASLSSLTDGSGWYNIKGIPPGPHTVEATALGYNRVSVALSLHPKLLRGLDFTLEKGGEDVRLVEPGDPGFSEAGRSFLWAAPLLMACSVCALAAAMSSWRRRPGKLALALGGASVLSLGFGAGSALAAAGTVLLAAYRAGLGAGGRGRRGMPSAAPLAPPPEQAECELVEVEEGKQGERRAGVAGATGAKAERLPGGTGEKAPEADGEGSGGRPRRLVQRAGSERILCCVCINEIGAGQSYIQCVCGRRVHVVCAHEPECPECGHPFGRLR